MVGQIIFYILGSIFLICGGVFAYNLVKLVKNPFTNIDYENSLKKLIIIAAIGVISFVGAISGAYGFIKETPKFYEVIQGVIGGIIFSAALFTFFGSFAIHYYRKELPLSLDKWLYRILIISIPTVFVFFFVMTNGYANYWSYPLPNGINFQEGFVNPSMKVSPNIAFYALAILTGAIFVYFLCDHKFYKQYGKHGLLESTFFVAFPAGILGARIFYVIGEWADFADRVMNGEWWSIFAIWEGGLTILGGAATGIVIGVAWFMWRNKGYSIWVAVDIIVPTILIAQAVGRWGNFFNAEVHGLQVSEEYFRWLPTLVFNNAHYSCQNGFAETGNIYVPLFFIESILNMIGYLLIGELFSRKLRKYTELGDLAFGYVFWYGLVRTILEPLRDPAFNMGEDGYWSYVWSIMFIAVGVLLIVLNHVIRYFIKKHKNLIKTNYKWARNGIIAIAILAIIGVTGIVIGSNMMINSTFSPILSYNPFNIGLIILVLGISFIISIGLPLPYMIEGIKEYRKNA